MEFSVNSPVLYVIVGILVAVVLAQSVFFLVKALFTIGVARILYKRGVL